MGVHGLIWSDGGEGVGQHGHLFGDRLQDVRRVQPWASEVLLVILELLQSY